MRQKGALVFFLSLFLLCASNTYANEGKRGGFRLVEKTFGTGYGFGDIKPPQDDYSSLLFYVRFGFRLNDCWGFPNHRGELQFAVEPLFNHLLQPNSGILVGVGLGFYYWYPLGQHLSWYSEVNVAPHYLSIDTIEQADAGFNFLDVVGTGLRWHFADNKTINLGYRLRHISDANISDGPNSGIDTHSVVLSVTFISK